MAPESVGALSGDDDWRLGLVLGARRAAAGATATAWLNSVLASLVFSIAAVAFFRILVVVCVVAAAAVGVGGGGFYEFLVSFWTKEA